MKREPSSVDVHRCCDIVFVLPYGDRRRPGKRMVMSLPAVLTGRLIGDYLRSILTPYLQVAWFPVLRRESGSMQAEWL